MASTLANTCRGFDINDIKLDRHGIEQVEIWEKTHFSWVKELEAI